VIRSRYETATDSRVSLSLSRIYALLSAERRIYLMLFKVAESLLHVSAHTLTHGGSLASNYRTLALLPLALLHS